MRVYHTTGSLPPMLQILKSSIDGETGRVFSADSALFFFQARPEKMVAARDDPALRLGEPMKMGRCQCQHIVFVNRS